MDPQQPTLAQLQAMQNGAWGPIYGAAFMNQCMHPQLQQLADAQWKLELSAKLAAILEKLRERFARSQNVCLCQTWVGADGCDSGSPNSLEVTLWADPRLAIVLDPLFQDLRAKSCQGPVFFRNSMPGKVWRSGAVQIVQNLRILPPTLHPRSQLSEEALERLAEALYIPIYDLARPAKGQVCVLEVLLSTRATEAMLVADVISFIGSLLTALHLSLANPVQQPVRRSVLCGRRARAQDSDDGEASGGEAAGSGEGQRSRQPQPEQQLQPPSEAAQADGAAGPGTSVTAQPAHTVEACAERQQQQQNRPAGVVTDPGAGAGKPSAERHEPGGRRDAGAATAEAAAGGPAAQGGALPARCPPAGCVAPACSEQPTLPASPSHERGAVRCGEVAASDGAAAGRDSAGVCPAPADGGHVDRAGQGGGGGWAVPRKVRKLLEGPMQRTKSVVSVAALSDGVPADDEDEEGEDAPAGNGHLRG